MHRRRVQRIMQEQRLCCRIKRRFLRATNSRHGYRRYPSLLPGARPTTPTLLWVADLTSIRLREQFLYLARILD